MSQQHGELEWRETYFILFPAEQRPSLIQIDDVLSKVSDRVVTKNQHANEDGLFESILVDSPADHAALEISYEAGDAVIEQSLEIAKQLKSELDGEQLQQLMRSNARLDIMHFERLDESAPVFADDEGFSEEEMLDPTCLLLTVDALVDVTGGIPIDPASGTVMI